MHCTHRSSARGEVGQGNSAINSKKEFGRVRPEEPEYCYSARGDQQSRNLSFIRIRRSLVGIQSIRKQKREEHHVNHS
jgi:hypothetical protein